MRMTVSLCPTCYKEIPAVISVGDHVMMEKYCTEHGPFTAMVERSPEYYAMCERMDNREFYAGYFIDVTQRCNLKCQYCYYPVDNRSLDPSADSIVQDCMVNGHRAPIILTGGEPTMRDDLPALISRLQKTVGQVELLTNGVRLGDEKYLDSLISLLREGDNVRINLSVHKEAGKLEVLDHLRARGLKLESILVVVDELGQIDGIVSLMDEYRDVIASARVKAATRIWSEQKPEETVFVSDMLNYLMDKGVTRVVANGRNNKTNFCNVVHNGLFLMLVAWYGVHNVDLIDIDCAPWYRARNGQVCNMVTAGLINEGMAKGWLNGKNIPSLV